MRVKVLSLQILPTKISERAVSELDLTDET